VRRTGQPGTRGLGHGVRRKKNKKMYSGFTEYKVYGVSPDCRQNALYCRPYGNSAGRQELRRNNSLNCTTVLQKIRCEFQLLQAIQSLVPGRVLPDSSPSSVASQPLEPVVAGEHMCLPNKKRGGEGEWVGNWMMDSRHRYNLVIAN